MTRTMLGLILAAATAAAADLPKAETVLDRFVEVTGGKAAYEAAKTQYMRGSIEFVGAGITGTVTTWLASSPNRSRIEMELAGMGKIDSGSSGETAWQNSAMQGPRLLTGNEAKQALRSARMNAPLAWREIYSAAVTEAEEEIDGKPCYRLALEPKDEGKAEKAWYEKESGLLRKSAMTVSTPMGDVPLETMVSDYREIGGGLKAPFSMTQKAGPQTIKTTIAEMKHNPEVPAAIFDPPAEIQKLLAK
ncbi:MAG: DUF620 domain-containing protein [Bryobacteraceae bacterium]|nr:DUF620 domain-containing protein [Bryobacteraceae bacterium]